MKYTTCKNCKHCNIVQAQDGFTFCGCRHEPYHNKWIAEIKKCPGYEFKSKKDSEFMDAFF